MKKQLNTTLLAVVLMLISGLASASTLDPIFSYDIKGALQEIMNVKCFYSGDADNSGNPEFILVTSGQGGSPYTELKNSVFLFNSTGELRWRYKMDREILSCYVGDVDRDNKLEIVVSSGVEKENIQRSIIRIINDNGDVNWQFSKTAIVNQITSDDINGDKYPDLILGTEGAVYVLEQDGGKIWSYPEEGRLNQSVQSLSTVDYNDKKFVVYGSDRVSLLSPDGELSSSYTPDADLGPSKREVSYVSEAVMYPGSKEVIAISTGGKKLFVLEMNTSNQIGPKMGLDLKWVYAINERINKILPYNLDSDSYTEILMASENGNIYALDNTGSLLWSFRLDGAAKDIALADVENDGEMNLMALSRAGTVYSLATDGRVHWKYETNTTLEKMALGDINGDGMQEIVVVTNEPKMYGLALNYTFVQKTSADNIYSEGTRLYRDNSLLEARETLSRAMAIYYNLGFQTEVDKVQSLIDKIDAQISEDRRELADTYYEKARDYYITGEYDSAKRFVSMSKEIYKEFGDSENVLKCELLELRINTVSMPTTMPIVTTVPTTMPNQAVVTIPLGYVLLIGLLLVTSIAVLLYVKKSKDEKREENVKESWENSLLSGNNKVDIKLGGEEDEE